MDPAAGTPSPSAALALEAERLSLGFELGGIAGTQGRAKGILEQALAAGDWPLLIAMHRQLGMQAAEGGDYSLARVHLDRACHYAEDLQETSFLAERIPSFPARVALRADCLRELALAESRAGESALAVMHLAEATQELTRISDKPVAQYLSKVIDYQAARVAYSTEHDYEAALSTLQASYRSLQRFDNPVRLATVLESLVQLDMDFLRGRTDSAPDLRATLEKIRRVRRLRGHDYVSARTTMGLGDLEFALGRYPEALDQYDEARAEFNRLGKYPELARTLCSMAQCDARLGNATRTVDMLEDFLNVLDELGLHALQGEIRATIARLRTRRVTQGQIATDTEMIDVGEYRCTGGSPMACSRYPASGAMALSSARVMTPRYCARAPGRTYSSALTRYRLEWWLQTPSAARATLPGSPSSLPCPTSSQWAGTRWQSWSTSTSSGPPPPRGPAPSYTGWLRRLLGTGRSSWAATSGIARRRR